MYSGGFLYQNGVRSSSLIISRWSKKHNIKTFFSGSVPSEIKTDFLDSLDYENCYYLGDNMRQTDINRIILKSKAYIVLYDSLVFDLDPCIYIALNEKVPVISTPVGEIKNIIKNGENGFLIRSEFEFLSSCEKVLK